MAYLDLRDLDKELDELKDRRDDEDQDWPLDEEDTERLAALEDLAGQLGGSLFQDETTMIPEEDFEDYAQDWAGDVGYAGDGALKDNPLLNYIDWGWWAESLKPDYLTVTFDGDDYLIRSC